MKYPVLLTLLIPATVFADPVNLNLESIKLNELAKIAFTQILDTGYIADDDFNREEKTVTVMLNKQSQSDVREAITRLIKANGYDLMKQGSALYITKHKEAETPEDEKVTFYYQPKYRNTQYITDLVGSIFTKGRFTFQRAIPSPTSATAIDAPKVQDTGTSAYSQQSRNYDSFIFYGTKKEVAQLDTLLQQIDKPSGEILVKAFIYEVTDTNSNQTAFSAAVTLLNTKLSIGASSTPLSNSISFKNAGIEAVFSALSTDSRFKVVSAPSLRVKDRETARFSVGAEVPVLGSVSYQTTGQPVQNVQYKNSGVILDILPTIRADSIELDIKQQLSNFIPTNTGVNNSPTLIKRELSSVVNSQNDDVIVLGGLEESKTNDAKSGFKWLPDWLSNKASDHSKSDILLILHVQRL